jgi:hypothetical protein
MNEGAASLQAQERKTCALAKWSLGLAVAGPLAVLLLLIVDCSLGSPGPLLILSLITIVPVAAAAAIVVGVISIFRVKRSKGRLKGMRLAMTGTLMGAGISAALVYMVFWSVMVVNQVICGMNISGLGKTMAVYANDYDGEYPTADRWCDLVIELEYVHEKQFRCPANKKQRCSYALNPYCGPNSPNDVVLLFETKGRWNQYGGRELLSTHNHGGKGCHVCFNDLRVRFVKSEELGKLRWKVEEEADSR